MRFLSYPQPLELHRVSGHYGIKSVQKNAAKEGSFELKVAKNGKFYFSLDARNGEVIGSSQMYASKSGRKRGIASVTRVAPGAEVRDLS